MDKEDKQIIGLGCGLVVILAVIILIIILALDQEFDGCKGLQGVVNQIWTGEQCEESL